MARKCICPICNQKNKIENNKFICQGCHNPLDLEICDLVNKSNKHPKKAVWECYLTLFRNNKNDIFVIKSYLIKYPLDMMANYAKMFTNIASEEDDFFNKENYLFTEDDKNLILNHIVEHYSKFKKENLEVFFKKYANPEFINKVWPLIENKGLMKEEILEKDLREQLFGLTFLPNIEVKNKRFDRGVILISLGVFAAALFYLILLFTANEDVYYPLAIFYMIIPTFALTAGIIALINKKNWLIKIFVFIILFYILTYLITIPYHESSFLVSLKEHALKIILAPYDYIDAIFERSKKL